MTHQNSYCARGNHPNYNTAAENVTFILQGKFAKAKSLRVWYSNLTQAQGQINPPDSQMFQKLQDLPVINNQVSIMVYPEDLYTLTTLTTGSKGQHNIPTPSPLPIPYTQTFDDETLYAPARLWYDQMGAWEINARAGGGGNVMRQVSTVWPACWGYSCDGPTTYFGPQALPSNTAIKMDVLAENTFGMTLDINGGSHIILCTNGTWAVNNHRSASGLNFNVGMWHNLEIQAYSNRVVVNWDGNTLYTDSSAHTPNNWYLRMQIDRYVNMAIDNFSLTALQEPLHDNHDHQHHHLAKLVF